MPGRFVTDESHEAGVKALAEADLHKYFGLVADQVRSGGYVAGPELTLADLYLGVCIHWQINLSRTLTDAYPELASYLERVVNDPRIAEFYQSEFYAEA